MNFTMPARVALAATLLLLLPGAALAQDASPLPSEPTASAPTSTGRLAESFPAEVGGVLLADSIQLVTGTEVAADDELVSDVLSSAADALGISLDQITVGSAYTFTDLAAQEGVLILALQAPGMTPQVGTQLMLDIFANDPAQELTMTEAEVAGHPVLSLSSPDDPESVAYVYAGASRTPSSVVGHPVSLVTDGSAPDTPPLHMFAAGDVLWMVATTDQAVVEGAMTAVGADGSEPGDSQPAT